MAIGEMKSRAAKSARIRTPKTTSSAPITGLPRKKEETITKVMVIRSKARRA
jgi:hypothetical protein